MEPRPKQPDLDWGAVGRGAVAGLAVIVPVTIVRAVLERDLTDLSSSAWLYVLSGLILVAYLVAGWTAGRASPWRPVAAGALAGAGAVVLWLPLRVVIWAVRESGRGLVSGDRAALPPGQVVGALALGAALGALGAAAGRRVRDAARVPSGQRGA